MARHDLTKLLNSPDKGVTSTDNSPNGTIAQLFRLIISDLDVGLERWGTLMRAYVQDPENRISTARKDQTSARGNLTAAFIKPYMTWKVFCKALRFFQVWKIDIAIRLYHRDGQQSLHSTEMFLGAEDLDSDDGYLDDYDDDDAKNDDADDEDRDGK